ncbi:hypothetical protein CL622_09105 [archaeon]|nr:hypothetical protein [archaeon]
MKIYSKIEPDKLILSLLRRKDISEYRTDIGPDEEYLQVSGRFLKKNTKVKAHKHIPTDRKTDITQEAWLVLEGAIKSVFYDLDDSILYETNISAGDCVVLFRGGHSLEVLEEDTVFYEFKTGPYYGVDADKKAINE